MSKVIQFCTPLLPTCRELYFLADQVIHTSWSLYRPGNSQRNCGASPAHWDSRVQVTIFRKEQISENQGTGGWFNAWVCFSGWPGFLSTVTGSARALERSQKTLFSWFCIFVSVWLCVCLSVIISRFLIYSLYMIPGSRQTPHRKFVRHEKTSHHGCMHHGCKHHGYIHYGYMHYGYMHHEHMHYGYMHLDMVDMNMVDMDMPSALGLVRIDVKLCVHLFLLL